MDIKWLGVIFLFGIIIGAYLHKLFNKPEVNVESAIELLKEKGYWVKININPKDNIK